MVVSRAPLAKLDAYKAQKGWSIAWFSSFGSDFNYDFHVTLDSMRWTSNPDAQSQEAPSRPSKPDETGRRVRTSAGGLSKARLSRMHDVMAGHVASMTKPITAAAAKILVEESTVYLDFWTSAYQAIDDYRAATLPRK